MAVHSAWAENAVFRERLPIYVTDRMIGHRLEEFAPTRSFRGHARSDTL